jgi:4-alpha-glucanotransferase
MILRESGILLHITSMPSSYGIGDLGPLAYRFADLLAESRQGIWQINPLNPTCLEMNNNPYDSPSAFAGNTLLINPEDLLEWGLIDEADLDNRPAFPQGIVDYSEVTNYKETLFQTAYEHFKDCGFKTAEEGCRFVDFRSENSGWLEDYALFTACKDHFGDRAWNQWPLRIRDRADDALDDLRQSLCDRMEKEKFLQYIFFQQWFSLKEYCNRLGIRVLGDVPIYVSYDSADVWTHPEIFDLDESKRPRTISGVPPDSFNENGQLWANPTYRWDILAEKDYAWFIRRIEHNLKLFDLLRIDHFRGLVAYWAVKAGSKTAIRGRWIEAPAEDFLRALLRRLPCLPIIAEDLGFITADVREVVNKFEIPSMRVLQFAFGEDIAQSPHIPHNFIKNCVAYTGTHDTNTARGWFEEGATPEEKQQLFCYLGREVTAAEVSWEMIRLTMLSVAEMVVTPMQDVLGLGTQARMNRPGENMGNYQWRLLPEQLTLDKRLRMLTEIGGRA